MRRPVARGRIVPQSLSTDPRLGRLSLKAALLFPLMWINADDQGRLSGDPDEIKYSACPNIDHITRADIPGLLKELEDQGLIKGYTTSKTKATQMLDWWEEQRLQWAYPSRYPPPEGWTDHLRYHPTPTEIITENWPPLGQPASKLLPSKLPSALAKELPSKPEAPSPQAEEIRAELMPLPYSESRILEHERIKEKLAELGARKGYIPQEEAEVDLGRIDLCWQNQAGEVVAAFEIETLNPKGKSLAKLANLKCRHKFIILRTNAQPFQTAGDLILIGLNRRRRRPLPLAPGEPKERQGSEERESRNKTEKGKRRGRGILPSKLGSRPPPSAGTHLQIYDKFLECYEKGWGKKAGGKVLAQMRDFSQELSAAGCPVSYVQEAFKEAASSNKYSLSYVRAMLLDWLGVPRSPP